MSEVFLVGDLHLGHRNICKYRPEFTSTEEHDKFVTEQVLTVAHKRNTLVLMGDCFFTEESLDSLREFRKAFGRIVFIIGNHDSDNQLRQRNIKTIFKEELIDDIHSLWSYKGYWLSHAPIHHEELRGRKNIHGHCHTYVISDTENYKCVSLEQIEYKPISLKELRKVFPPHEIKHIPK